MIIVGAGLAGLIAGFVFPNASIIERSPQPQEGHKALLRFRSDAVSLLTAVPFRRVLVHKGIWSRGEFRQPDIRLANMYAAKVSPGRLADRSIWKLDAAERFVAPEDLYDRLIESLHKRIEWNTDVDSVTAMDGSTDIVINTSPLGDAAQRWLQWRAPSVEFKRAPIVVGRYRIPGLDLHQTIYFPDKEISTYRASITNDLLIVESMDEERAMDVGAALVPFGLRDRASDVETVSVSKQSYGKISPIDEHIRKELIHRLSVESGVYSVGRFATWRNILLDDVVKDLRIVQSMIQQDDAYNRRLRR